MMGSGAALVFDLRDSSMTIELVSDQIVIAPCDRITDQLRGRVRYHRKEIIEQLRLEQRIRAMADRWSFFDDELAVALAGAQSDPESWNTWTERDERDFGGCVTQQDFAKAYARARGLV